MQGLGKNGRHVGFMSVFFQLLVAESLICVLYNDPVQAEDKGMV